MKCVVCKTGVTAPGRATVTLEREGLTLVVKSVPARICRNCGEEYVDDRVATQLLKEAEKSSRRGVQVDIRHFEAA